MLSPPPATPALPARRARQRNGRRRVSGGPRDRGARRPPPPHWSARAGIGCPADLFFGRGAVAEPRGVERGERPGRPPRAGPACRPAGGDERRQSPAAHDRRPRVPKRVHEGAPLTARLSPSLLPVGRRRRCLGGTVGRPRAGGVSARPRPVRSPPRHGARGATRRLRERRGASTGRKCGAPRPSSECTLSSTAWHNLNGSG